MSPCGTSVLLMTRSETSVNMQVSATAVNRNTLVNAPKDRMASYRSIVPCGAILGPLNHSKKLSEEYGTYLTKTIDEPTGSPQHYERRRELSNA